MHYEFNLVKLSLALVEVPAVSELGARNSMRHLALAGGILILIVGMAILSRKE